MTWDIGEFKNGVYLGGLPLYDKAAEVGLSTWSGNWKSFKDKPYYQLAIGLIKNG